jgi:hypothetical protein
MVPVGRNLSISERLRLRGDALGLGVLVTSGRGSARLGFELLRTGAGVMSQEAGASSHAPGAREGEPGGRSRVPGARSQIHNGMPHAGLCQACGGFVQKNATNDHAHGTPCNGAASYVRGPRKPGFRAPCQRSHAPRGLHWPQGRAAMVMAAHAPGGARANVYTALATTKQRKQAGKLPHHHQRPLAAGTHLWNIGPHGPGMVVFGCLGWRQPAA